MRELIRTKAFKKEFAKAKLIDGHFARLMQFTALLMERRPLPAESKDHPLSGNWEPFREFHLGGDMLVIYFTDDEKLILERIGTHSQLFG